MSGSGGTASVSLGAIARYAGGTIDFTLPTSGSIATTTTTAGPGVLVDASNNGTAYASVNGGSTFATVSSGQIVALTAYSNSNSFLTATSQTLITSSTSASGTTGVVAFSNSNTILTLTGNNDIDAGGILVTPAALGTVITGGSLHAGGGNAVVIMNYGSLNVASAIVDNASGASLTVSGPGVTTLSNANTYSGTTYINNGATLQVGNGGLGASIGGTSGVTDNGDLVVNHGDAVTLSQIIRGMGGMTQTGSGLLTLTGDEHVHRRHDDQRRHAADWQRHDRRLDRQFKRHQHECCAGLQPGRQPELSERHQWIRRALQDGRRHARHDR